MFTQEQRNHINDVKDEIENHIVGMLHQPWWDGKFTNDIFLTGGAIASLIQGEQPNDWDFYTKNMTDNKELANHLELNCKRHIEDIEEKYKDCLGKDGKMITTRAITMKTKDSFITMLSGDPVDVRATFDYVHCMPYYDLRTRKLYISEKQYACCKHKLLVVNNAKNIKGYRMDKFLKRGYVNVHNVEDNLKIA